MRSRIRLGSAFSDSLIAGSKQANIFDRSNRRLQWWHGAGRILLLTVFLWILLFILIARLFTLTIIEGHQFRVLSDDNRTRELIRHAPRGILYDRAGKAFVTNIPQYRLLAPCEDQVEKLCVSRLRREDGDILQKQGLPPQHFLEVEYRREYLYPEEVAHVVGYTGEITDEEITDDYYKLRKYKPGDHIGRAASEAVFEEKLRGRDGKELVEVDASGKILRELGRDPELPGEDVHLTIDAEFSKAVYKAFPAGKKGAVIVSKPGTGEILAMFSSPTYSLNVFSQPLTDTQYTSLMTNKNLPLFNRAIGGIYPPGSTYKIVTSLAGLETGAITSDTKIEDTGVITIGPFSFPNWYFNRYGKTEGMVDVTRALARSNDIYFYKAGEAIGITKLREFSTKVGVGSLLGIELPGEAEGLLPGPEWKKNHFTSPADIENRQHEWYLGDTYHMSIGQGYLLTTPLQVNAWTNIIANDGYRCAPTIQLDRSGQAIGTKKPCKDLNIKQRTIDVITQGMIEACSEGGTAYPLFDFRIQNSEFRMNEEESKEASPAASGIRVPLACKTGTAEYGDVDDNTHAWITVFAPIPEKYIPKSQRGKNTISGDPEVSVTVLVEEAGEGSDQAAPVAKKILEAWFAR